MGTRAIRLMAGAGAALGLAASLAGCSRQVAPTLAPETEAPLVARADLFGDPARQNGMLSPRGDRIAFLAPRDGVTNLWVLSVDAIGDARALTDDRVWGVSSVAWAHDNATLLYAVDEGGDEATRLYAVAADSQTPPRALTPAGFDARIIGLSSRDPSAVVVALRGGTQAFANVVRIDIASGDSTVLYRNTGGYSEFLVDGDNQLRVGVKRVEGGGQEVAVREANGRWRTLFPIAFADAMSSRLIAFEAGGASFLMLDSTDRDRTALVRVDVASGVKTVVGEGARADVVDVWLDPGTNAPEAFATEYLRREWRALTPEAQADLDFLDGQLSGEFEIVSRSGDDNRWIVEESGPTTPTRSHLYDRAARRVSLLFRHWPSLEQAPLQPMTPIEIEARDGLLLVSYLTLPVGADSDGDARPDEPTPLVITPHDGPWARDSFGYSALHQWLANRGYAALSINFRGSLGFSKAFVNAGNGEWGGRVQNDIADAVRWAVDSRVAREDRVAILGAGFGGYLALAGVALSPGQYRCSASFGGPINLGSFVEQTPAPTREEIRARIGDARTPEGRQALRDASPLFRANRVENAVLLALGGRDARLVRGEFDQFAQALRSRESGLTYAVFPGEGRELRQPANRLAYYAILEHFLGDCLGGREEPVGAAFEGARIDVFDGAVNVPGLSAFARRPAEVTRAAPTLDSAASPHEDIASAPDAPQPVELEPLSVP